MAIHYMAGIEAYKNRIKSSRTRFPDVNFKTDELFIKGNRIVLCCTATGTNTGPFDELEIPATGRKAEISEVHIFRVVNGKIAQEKVFYYNAASFLMQLGFTITPPTTEEQ